MTFMLVKRASRTIFSARKEGPVVKPAPRVWGTNEAVGLASIIDTIANGAWNLDQDLKGRWHVWRSPATEADRSDHIARHLEPDLV
jgi:hypothetical protein